MLKGLGSAVCTLEHGTYPEMIRRIWLSETNVPNMRLSVSPPDEGVAIVKF